MRGLVDAVLPFRCGDVRVLVVNLVLVVSELVLESHLCRSLSLSLSLAAANSKVSTGDCELETQESEKKSQKTKKKSWKFPAPPISARRSPKASSALFFFSRRRRISCSFRVLRSVAAKKSRVPRPCRKYHRRPASFFRGEGGQNRGKAKAKAELAPDDKNDASTMPKIAYYRNCK